MQRTGSRAYRTIYCCHQYSIGFYCNMCGSFRLLQFQRIFGYGVINTYYVFAHFLFLRFDFLVLNQNEGLWILINKTLPVFRMGIKIDLSAFKTKRSIRKRSITFGFKSFCYTPYQVYIYVFNYIAFF